MSKSVEQFVQDVVDSGLLSSDEVASFIGRLSTTERSGDAQALARELVKSGKLTKFQAAAVYQGKTKGLVFGEYVVLDKIGAGGMGQVFKAQHRRMKRTVAIKLMSLGSSRNADAVKRFYQEVEMAARLNHPNIVTAYDAGEAEGLHFLVMEFVDGRDLMSVLKEHGTLPVDQVVSYIQQAAEGLAYAHAQGVIHRDIKPANLLLDKQGRVKILDMGLARLEDPLSSADAAANEGLTQMGQILGTVDYMPPEQAANTRGVDHRADIYSLGCTLYRLLTGQPPYSGDTIVRKILNHRDQPIPLLRDLRPDVPAHLDSMFRRMVAKRPEERYASMAEILADLATVAKVATGHDASVFVPQEIPSGGSSLGSFLQSTSVSDVQLLKKAKPMLAKAKARARPVEATTAGGKQGHTATDRPISRRPVVLACAGGGFLLAMLATVGMLFSGNNRLPDPQPVDDSSVTQTTAEAVGLPPVSATNLPATPPLAAEAPAPAPAAPSELPTTDPPDPPPAMADNAATPQAVDILAQIDPLRDTVSGTWRQTPEGLLRSLEPGFGILRLPVDPPPFYELEAEVRMVAGNESFGFVLTWHGRQFSCHTNGWNAQINALQLVDGMRGNMNDTASASTTLTPGEVSKLLVRVSPSAVQMYCDGSLALEYRGPPERLSLAADWSVDDANRLGIVCAGNVSYLVSKLQLLPLVPGESATPLPGLAPQVPRELTEPVDLLARISPERHRIMGNWQMEQGRLTIVPGERSMLVLPYPYPDQYQLRLEVERPVDGTSPLGIGLLFDGKPIVVLLSPNYSGVQFLDNLPAGDARNPSHRRGPALPNRQRNEIVCQVARGGLRVMVNGQPVIDYQGDASRLQLPGGWGPPVSGRLFLHADSPDARFVFSRIELAPPAALESDSEVAVPTDLLARYDPVRGAVAGEWKFEDQMLEGPFFDRGEGPRVQLLGNLPAEYRLDLIVERVRGEGPLVVGLPCRTGHVGLNLYWDQASLSQIDGRSRDNASSVDVNVLPPVRATLISAVVRSTEIVVLAEGRELIRWNNLPRISANPFWRPNDPAAVVIGGTRAVFRVWRVVATPLSTPVDPVDPYQLLSPTRGQLRPDTRAVEVAGEAIRSILRGTDAGNVGERRRLLAQLLARGDDADPSVQYAALSAALDVAAGGGNLEVTLSTAQQLAWTFDVELAEVLATALNQLAAAARAPDARRQLAQRLLRQFDHCVQMGQFDMASQLERVLDELTRRQRDANLIAELKPRSLEITEYLQLAGPVEAARAALADAADDSAAHALLGEYLCLARNQWKAGLEHLSRSNDAKLKAAADLELAAGRDPAALLAAGDAWWDAVERVASKSRKALWQQHAVQLYQQVRSAAQGADAGRIDSRSNQWQASRRALSGAFGSRHPLDAVKLGDHWYQLIEVPLTWQQSRELCEQLDGYLCIVETKAENDAIKQLIHDRLKTLPTYNVWIGASDHEREGAFRWINGQPVGFADWLRGEPNNSGPAGEHYVGIAAFPHFPQPGWNDFSESTRGFCLCEWDQ